MGMLAPLADSYSFISCLFYRQRFAIVILFYFPLFHCALLGLCAAGGSGRRSEPGCLTGDLDCDPAREMEGGQEYSDTKLRNIKYFVNRFLRNVPYLLLEMF